MKTKPRKISLWFISICIFGLIFATQAWSDTYFVDVTNGDDANDGESAGSAWKTIEYAVPELKDGDVLNVAPGNYEPADLGQGIAANVTKNGVTIQGAQGVIIDGRGDDDGPCWQYGINITGSNVVLRDLEIMQFRCDGAKAIRIGGGSNNRIESCIVSNNDYNIVFDSNSGTGNVVEDCTIFNSSIGIDVQDASPQIRANTIYDSSTGINVAETSSRTIQPTIVNNLIYQTGTGTYDMFDGIYMSAFSTESVISALIYHNTLNGGLSDGIYVSQEETPATFDIKYNIITNFGEYGIKDASAISSNPTVDYNNVYNPDGTGNYLNVTIGINDFSQDAFFADEASYNFRLQEASPCRDYIPLSAEDPITQDIEKIFRPQGSGFDIGAYEYPVTQYTLTVNVAGSGSVTLSPSGGIYADGTQVTLTPVPANGWAFSQWDGDLSGSENPTTINMDADKTVTATFVQKAAPDKPTAINPLDEDSVSDGSAVSLTASAYNDPDGDSHVRSTWEVWRADTGELIENLSSVTDLTSHIIGFTLTDGLKYYWRVNYESSDGIFSPWSENYAFKVGTNIPESLPAIAAGQNLGDFGMISIVHWPDDPSPQAVFNIDYDPVNYRIGTYDANTGSYIEFGEGVEMEPGRCYWILAREGLTVNFEGIQVSLTENIFVALDYNTSTLNGWNMVAPPNEADYWWRSVQIVEDVAGALTTRGTVQSLSDTNPYIDRRLWRWENGAYAFDTPDTDANLEMQAYAGYWVQAKKANVYLMFEPAARVSSLGLPRTMIAQAWHTTKTWMNNLNLFSKEAIADSDSPPMPPAALDENTVDPIFGGCYVEAIRE